VGNQIYFKIAGKKKIDRRVEPPDTLLKKIFSSETTEPISTKLCWNDSWVVLFQNCVRHFRTPTKMAATAELNPSNDYFINILFLLSKWFQTKRFLREFPIGSYDKLSSAVAAVLVGVLKCRTHFWKRTTPKKFPQLKMWDNCEELFLLKCIFFIDSLLLVTQIIKGKQLYYKMWSRKS
jgi:hypothetical protein